MMPTLIGRREQLRLVEEAADRVRAGEPRFILVGGEAGVGKTHLIEYCAGRLQADGFRVLRGACVELGSQGLVLAPISAALRDLLQQIGVERVSRALPGWHLLQRLVPELDPAETAATNQGQLFELIGVLLRQISAEAPLLLVIDDLHWADRSTRDLVDYLARTVRDARLAVVGAYRTDALKRGHPMPGFVAQLARLPEVIQVQLARFGRAETAQLIGELLGRPASEDVFERIFRLSGGNAFFIDELVRSSATTDRPRLPESVRDLLLDRVERLPGSTRHVIRIAAASGLPISHWLLSATAGLDEDALLEALRRAVDAHVLLVDDVGDSAYRFRHVLLREVVAQDLLPAERMRLQRALAEALEAHSDVADSDAVAAELALRWSATGELQKALPALLRAAAKAEAKCAHAEQSSLLLRALDIWPRVTDSDEVAGFVRWDTWEKVVTGAVWAGEYLQALALADRALAAIDRTARSQQAAMLVALRCLALHGLGRDGVDDGIQEALSLAAGARSEMRAKVLDLLGVMLMMRGRSELALDVCDEARHIASEVGEQRVEANARTTLGVVLAQLSDYEAALAELRNALQLSEAHGDPMQTTRVYLNFAFIFETIGAYDDAVEAARTGLRVAEKAGLSRSLGWNLRVSLVAALTALGRWDEAEAAIADALELDPVGRFGTQLHTLRGQIALARGQVEIARDRRSLAATSLGEAMGRVPEALGVARLEAEVALRENRPAEARAAIAGVLPLIGERGAAGEAWRLVCTAAQALPASDDLVETLRGAAARLPIDTPPRRACAAQFAAELGDDGAAWPAVVSAWESIGESYSAAYARLRAAEFISASDPTGAGVWLRTAEDEAERLGATFLLGAIRAVSRAVNVGPGADSVGAVERLGLTDRELEVLRLLAEGQTNRRIAEQLVISPKTVSVHASRILDKLGVTNRVEAAAMAYRLRLFDPHSNLAQNG